MYRRYVVLSVCFSGLAGVVTSYRIMILLVEVQSQIFLLQAAGERAYENTIELDVDSAFQIEG